MNTTHEEITRLQQLVRELGLRSTSVRSGQHLGFGSHSVIVDWDGEEEIFANSKDAEKAIRNT